jgi:hypothetical protein
MLVRAWLVTLFLLGFLWAQDLTAPLAPGDRFSISHTPMNAKLVPLDCDGKKIPIHSYRHAGNEATFLIPQDSPTCTYEVLGTKIKVVRPPEPPRRASAETKPKRP